MARRRCCKFGDVLRRRLRKNFAKNAFAEKAIIDPLMINHETLRRTRLIGSLIASPTIYGRLSVELLIFSLYRHVSVSYEASSGRKFSKLFPIQSTTPLIYRRQSNITPQT